MTGGGLWRNKAADQGRGHEGPRSLAAAGAPNDAAAGDAWCDLERVVAAAFGVSSAQLRRAERFDATAVLARQTAMYLAHVGFGLAYAEIAAHFDKDRTTVAHACGRIEDRRDETAFGRIVDCLEAAVAVWRDQGLSLPGGRR